MTIYDLKIGDKLKVLTTEVDRKGNHTLNDILKITIISKDKDIPDCLWITHTPISFSGGGFRIGNENSSHCYKLGEDVEFVGNIKKESYEYLITLFKKLGIK